jgi:hypothetical protein
MTAERKFKNWPRPLELTLSMHVVIKSKIHLVKTVPLKKANDLS